MFFSVIFRCLRVCRCYPFRCIFLIWIFENIIHWHLWIVCHPGFTSQHFYFQLLFFIIYWILHFRYGLHFVNLHFIYILVMDDVDSLSLGYYPVSSSGVTSPDVLGDVDVDPVSFPQCKMDSDEQSLCCATFRLFKIGDIYFFEWIEKVGCSFWFDMEFCCF